MAADYEDVDITALTVCDTRVAFFKIYETFHDLGAAVYTFIDSHRFDLVQGFTEGDSTFEFQGNHFQHIYGVPTGGTITGLNILFNGVEQFDFTHFSMSILTAYNLFDHRNEKLVPLLLHGENTLRGSAFGDYIQAFNGNDKVFGNDGDDWLYGGKGDDKIHGGNGINYVYGDAGKDKFYFDVPLALGNNTVIHDFAHNKDRIYLEDSIFTGLPQSQHHLAASAFSLVDDHLTNLVPHIWYDKANGDFWYVAAGVSKHFGEVNDGANVTPVDFVIG